MLSVFAVVCFSSAGVCLVVALCAISYRVGFRAGFRAGRLPDLYFQSVPKEVP